MQINIWQVLFQALNFGAILFVLTKFLYKPILNVLETREKKINEGLAAADKSLKAEGEIEVEKKAQITKARKEALVIIKEAETTAMKKGDEIIAESRAKAKVEAERIINQAEAEKAQAMKAVEKDATTIAVAMAKKALSESLSSKEIDEITKKLIAKLG
ncbi:MAG: F0F1 ATP synthase subunit B [bacterium]